MAEYKPTIGLEIHAELKTASKMWCGCKNDPEERRPNFNVCPVCMGHPGTLPVANKGAIKKIVKVGLALGGKVANFTEFDRKNYFYPDIPKGYQLSQYKSPIVMGGSLNGITLTRVHLEEDTARSMHDKGPTTLVDFNRSGIPLMELVTEPVIHNPKTASDFARELQLLLRYLDAGEANMEKGEMRVEANISVSKGKDHGTKVEVKNLNSFRSVERAIEHEVKRQIEVLESGEKVTQETRGWDENKQETFSQRKKESSHDYRYFPDPDLPKFYLSEVPEFDKEILEKELPELPWEKRSRYLDLGIPEKETEIYVGSKLLGNFFDAEIMGIDNKLIRTVSNLITSDLVGAYKNRGLPEKINLGVGRISKLAAMFEEGIVSSRGAKDILKMMLEKDTAPEELAKKHGFVQKTDEVGLKQAVEKVIADNQKVVADYKAGKVASLQFLIGQCMKEAKGSGNPQLFSKILKELLN